MLHLLDIDLLGSSARNVLGIAKATQVIVFREGFRQRPNQIFSGYLTDGFFCVALEAPWKPVGGEWGHASCLRGYKDDTDLGRPLGQGPNTDRQPAIYEQPQVSFVLHVLAAEEKQTVNAANVVRNSKNALRLGGEPKAGVPDLLTWLAQYDITFAFFDGGDLFIGGDSDVCKAILVKTLIGTTRSAMRASEEARRHKEKEQWGDVLASVFHDSWLPLLATSVLTEGSPAHSFHARLRLRGSYGRRRRSAGPSTWSLPAQLLHGRRRSPSRRFLPTRTSRRSGSRGDARRIRSRSATREGARIHLVQGFVDSASQPRVGQRSRLYRVGSAKNSFAAAACSEALDCRYSRRGSSIR